MCYADSIEIFAVNSKKKKKLGLSPKQHTFRHSCLLNQFLLRNKHVPHGRFKWSFSSICFRSQSPLLVSPTVPHPTPSKELCYIVWLLRHRNWKCCLLLTLHHESSIADIYLANTSLGVTQHLETTCLPCYTLHSMTPLLFSIYYLFFPCHHVKSLQWPCLGLPLSTAPFLLKV